MDSPSALGREERVATPCRGERQRERETERERGFKGSLWKTIRKLIRRRFPFNLHKNPLKHKAGGGQADQSEEASGNVYFFIFSIGFVNNYDFSVNFLTVFSEGHLKHKVLGPPGQFPYCFS